MLNPPPTLARRRVGLALARCSHFLTLLPRAHSNLVALRSQAESAKEDAPAAVPAKSGKKGKKIAKKASKLLLLAGLATGVARVLVFKGLI